MNFIKTSAMTMALLASSIALVPAVKAQSTFHRITHVTFSGPVEVPGRVLPAGEYVFQLNVLPSNETSIVEIRDKDGEKLLVTLLSIPNYRLTPTGKTVILFRERAGDAPEALRAWFYPGENFGHEFAYPVKEATQLAAVNHVEVPAIADNTSDSDLAASRVTEATPTGEQAEVANTAPPATTEAPAQTQYQNSPAAQTTANNSDNNLVASNQPLPKTASPVFIIALLGGLFLTVGLSLGFLVNVRSQEERGL